MVFVPIIKHHQKTAAFLLWSVCLGYSDATRYRSNSDGETTAQLTGRMKIRKRRDHAICIQEMWTICKKMY
jgi:hypothetical protein